MSKMKTYKTEQSNCKKFVRTNNKKYEVICVKPSGDITFNRDKGVYCIPGELYTECHPREFFIAKADFENQTAGKEVLV